MSPEGLQIQYRFRIYVAGQTLNSVRAVANLGSICRTHLAPGYDIEVVDVLKNPERALQDGIIMTPTLLRLEPLPVLRIIGSLGADADILESLQITPRSQPA